jgi:hypothetical protein
MCELTIRLKCKTKNELQGASNILDQSLTLKTQFELQSKRNYNQVDGVFGQIRVYESADDLSHYSEMRG